MVSRLLPHRLAGGRMSVVWLEDRPRRAVLRAGGQEMSGSTPSMGGLVVTHHVRVDPSRSMKSVTADVQSLLGEYGEGSRRSCALLASELIAQIVGREPSWAGGPVGLTIQLRKDAIRMEATAPTAASSHQNGVAPEPL